MFIKNSPGTVLGVENAPNPHPTEIYFYYNQGKCAWFFFYISVPCFFSLDLRHLFTSHNKHSNDSVMNGVYIISSQ